MSKPPKPPAPGLPDKETLVRFLREAGEAAKADIAREFGLKGAERRALREMLAELEAEGRLGRRGRRGFTEAGALPPVGVVDVVDRDVDGEFYVQLVKGGEDAPRAVLKPERKGPVRPAPGIGHPAAGKTRRRCGAVGGRRAITAQRAQLKHAPGQIAGTSLFEELADAVSTSLMTSTIRIAVRIPAFNLVVTNVPGPPVPLYLLGARLLEVYPLVPLYETQALGVALFSYAGTLFVGLSACWHTVPDLHDLVADLADAFRELEQAAGLEVAA